MNHLNVRIIILLSKWILLRRCASVVSHYDRLSDTDEHLSKLASFFINVYLKTYGNPLKTETFMIEENARKAREKFVVIK